MKRYVSLDKMSKRARKACYAETRKPPIPPCRKGKGSYEYRQAKYNLKGI